MLTGLMSAALFHVIFVTRYGIKCLSPPVAAADLLKRGSSFSA